MIAAVQQPLLVAVGLAGAAVCSVWAARRTRVPTPVYLVLVGLVVSVVPGVQEIRLPPDVVFYGFLPPLLYAAAFVVSPREARQNWRSILVLALGLTAATLFAVGFVGWALVPGLGAAGAFLLGAVLGPTDPVSATSVLGETSAPERLRTILEGESLVNDGVGLVAFSIALTAVERGSYSVGDGLLKFLEVSVGGIAFGIAVAWIIERIRTRVQDAEVEIPLSLLTPYAAYIPADRLHLSGILATVACGVYLGWRSGGIFRPSVRLQSVAFWDALTFILTAVLFVLLGTQFRSVVHGLAHPSWWQPLVVFSVLLAVRLVWMLGFVRDTWPDRFILGWSGMRGALSLAAALSIPVSVAERDTVLYLTFTTILAGLVVLAVPLPWLLDALGFPPGETSASEAAAARRLRELVPAELRDLDEQRRELIAAQRAELARLKADGEISHAAARALERRLDLEETALSPR
ncbi:MAG TPA: sodium:proton antiporter [Gaiellaceae bacterium]